MAPRTVRECVEPSPTFPRRLRAPLRPPSFEFESNVALIPALSQVLSKMSRNCKPKLSEFVEKISDAEDPLNEIDDEYHPKVRRTERAGRLV